MANMRIFKEPLGSMSNADRYGTDRSKRRDLILRVLLCRHFQAFESLTSANEAVTNNSVLIIYLTFILEDIKKEVFPCLDPSRQEMKKLRPWADCSAPLHPRPVTRPWHESEQCNLQCLIRSASLRAFICRLMRTVSVATACEIWAGDVTAASEVWLMAKCLSNTCWVKYKQASS